MNELFDLLLLLGGFTLFYSVLGLMAGIADQAVAGHRAREKPCRLATGRNRR
jgi:hypothetical protein